MGEAGGDLDLLEKPLGAEGDRHLGMEHLDGNLTVVLQVSGEIHDGHPTPSQFVTDVVPGGESRLQL